MKLLDWLLDVTIATGGDNLVVKLIYGLAALAVIGGLVWMAAVAAGK